MKETKVVSALCLSDDIVKTLDKRHISEPDFVRSAACETSYKGNRHLKDTQIIVSPHYSAICGKVNVPVYATPVFVADGNYGTLHHFAVLLVDFAEESAVTVDFEKQIGFDTSDAILVSDSGGVLDTGKNGFSLTVQTVGCYTVVCGDSQDHALTLFVREKNDEKAQINELKEKYGEENVIVLQAGLHETDHLNFLKDGQVLYLCAGALWMPKHTVDITDDDQNFGTREDLALYCNSLGLTRFPVLNISQSDDILICGQGILDLSRLDWHERRGVIITESSHVSVENLIIVNPCEWSMTFHRCTDVKVSNCAVFGYRCNSDAFAICNTKNAVVTDCFSRTGDDMFEAKSLGGELQMPAENILFERCSAWGSKARCFGITGEIEQDIFNVTFKNSTVIWRDAVWNNDRIGSLVVIRERGTGTVSNILFENIRVLHDKGRAVNCTVLAENVSGTEIKDVEFRRITYCASMKSQVKSVSSGNSVAIRFCEVLANGELLQNTSSFLEISGEADASVQ